MEWTKSLQHLPTLTIKEIELFFGESGKTGKTTKRADNLLFENFLDSISCSHDTNYFYVKAICSASYTKNVYHQLSCCFSRTNVQVEYAYCTCKAGRGGFCNHVYALFKLTAQFVLDKLDEVPMQLSCTSRPCGWTVPKVRKMNIQKPTVMETVIKKPKLGKNAGVKCNLYEARSPDQQMFDAQAVFELQENLKEKNPKIPLVTGLHSSISSDRKPNDNPLYINASSNHPPSIIKQLPKNISKRISGISSSKEIFDQAAPFYNNALKASGYKENIENQPPEAAAKQESQRRKRKIIWFNPLYSMNVKTNVARKFLQLLDKHFPAHHHLHIVFNRNNVKVSLQLHAKYLKHHQGPQQKNPPRPTRHRHC